jgi:organic radical activating enzyme
MNKSYCHIPYMHIYSTPYGAYNLCSKANDNLSELTKFHTHKDLPFDVFFSEEMEQIRIDMESGKRVDACEWCYKMEDSSGGSERHRWNEMLDYDGYGYAQIMPHSVSIKLRMFGSYCNLECVMCPPTDSSSRRNALKLDDFSSFNLGPNNDKEILSNKQFDKIIDNIVQHSHYIKTLELMGGETLQLPRVFKLLERIPESTAKNITLWFSSNLTLLEYNGKCVNEYFKKFKNVECKFSVDHYQDEKLKWIRYPIDPDQLKRNLEKATKFNWDIYLATTATILNLEDLDDTIDYWVNNFGIIRSQYHGVAIQDIHSVKNHPNKKLYYSKYDEGGILSGEINKEYNPLYFNKAIDYWDLIDKGRGTNWRKIWPHFNKIELIGMKDVS